MDDQAQIQLAETRLRDAMLAGDVDVLDDLLSADSVFTNQVGARLSKADDLAAHRSGLLRIGRIEPRGQALIRMLGEKSAIVCITVDLAGSYGTQSFAGAFAYSRVWHRQEDGQWRVEAAHCSPVVNG